MEKLFGAFSGSFAAVQMQEISDGGARFAASAGLRETRDPIRANSEKVIAVTGRALNISRRRGGRALDLGATSRRHWSSQP
jgi:hypothetical protein